MIDNYNPSWYSEAFDKFNSIAEELFRQNKLSDDGYVIPDADGSKSTIKRNDAILNNSFNELALREALHDIYMNSSHKLIATNHDATHFYQWHGYMSDMEYIPSTDMCQISLPTETFIGSKERDRYKISQYYRKWIPIDELMNHWDIFHWTCLMFIDQKIASEYELRIDDHEVMIRFRYFDYWVKKNHPIYVYKFDTNYQQRIKVALNQIEHEWNWKIPVEYIDDKRILNSEKCIVTFNKMRDGRTDGIINVDPTGDNLEFCDIKDGYIDLKNLSKYNRALISSEPKHFLWMGIMVPKYFHEYPILLPTDVVYRPYIADFQPVVTMHQQLPQHVKVNDIKNPDQVYIDVNGKYGEKYDGWKTLIRPVVLSDAFDHPHVEPHSDLISDLDTLKHATIEGADLIEKFRIFMDEYTTDARFNHYLDDIESSMEKIHTEFNAFLIRNHMEKDREYESKYDHFVEVIKLIREDGEMSPYLNTSTSSYNDFWTIVSPVIHMARDLVDTYHITDVVNHIHSHNKVVWEDVDKFMGQVRFQRPVDTMDFWTFEYYPNDGVWRPYPLNVKRHYPDVYLLNDPHEQTPSMNRVFKSFFFYTDQPGILNESSDVVRASASWDDDTAEYYFDNAGTYKDIFMEKFYWMGIRTIYKGVLTTNTRWQILEYVIDNPSYERFNELFLTTMDPYFKLGLATYLKSDENGFPFDHIVEKMKEAINVDWEGYQKIANFEMYLNKSWIPAYFDYIITIMDDWNYQGRLLRRPRKSFDIHRILPVLYDVERSLYTATLTLDQDIDWLIEKIEKESYFINLDLLKSARDVVDSMVSNAKEMLRFINNLDLQIYSIDDVNHIIDMITRYSTIVSDIEKEFSGLKDHVDEKDVYEAKQGLHRDVMTQVNKLPKLVDAIANLINDFDIEQFMTITNDLDTYKDHDKYNPDDQSLLGYINKFEDAWSADVKEARNALFTSTSILYGTFNPSRSYDDESVRVMRDRIFDVQSDLNKLKEQIDVYWVDYNTKPDPVVDDKISASENMINHLADFVNQYMSARDALIRCMAGIKVLLREFLDIPIGMTEAEYKQYIEINLDNILEDVSYMCSKQDRYVAHAGINNIKSQMATWEYFLNVEEEVFTKLHELTTPPILVIQTLREYDDILGAVTRYLNTVNTMYTPDTSVPTYSDIYECLEIQLISGGFSHQVGDEVFIPNIGSYVITSVDGPVSSATLLQDLGYRITQFRDPTVQQNPYDVNTTGNGLAITVKPANVRHTRIINDDVVLPFVNRLQNALYLLDRYGSNANPYNNAELKTTISSIKSIQNDWNGVVRVYQKYMSGSVFDSTYGLIDILMTVIDPLNTFMDERNTIKLGEFVHDFEQFIFDTHKLYESLDLIDQDFTYYEDKLREHYTNLSHFYGNGTSWSDASELKELLAAPKYPLTLFNHRILEPLDDSDRKNDLQTRCTDLQQSISDITDIVNHLPITWLDVKSIMTRVHDNLDGLTHHLRKDIWYRITSVKIAAYGDRYVAGDIVEMIPQLPRDENGDPNHSNEEMIMDDVILMRVMEVEDGKAIKVIPLMNYALPYEIWGVRETKTRSGDGKDLKLDIESYPVTLNDCTLFKSEKYDDVKIDPFDENDMLMFKFDNNHDLDLKYEIYLGGSQTLNYFQRHFGNTDIIYLYANDVMRLRNSAITKPAEQYFVYRLDDVEIEDPGAGYSVGQEIIADAEQSALKLVVTAVRNEPTKGIAQLQLADAKKTQQVPGLLAESASIVDNSMSNIDDEFHVGYYDKLTRDGYVKPSTTSVKLEQAPFTSKRFDDLDDGDRNKTFMHPDVDLPGNVTSTGDPDYAYYAGTRNDNSVAGVSDDHIWNGIKSIVPEMHPRLDDSLRIPPNQPVFGEYQEIYRLKIHRDEHVQEGDLHVSRSAYLPRHVNDYAEGRVGKVVIVDQDEKYRGHRMAYRIRSFVAMGYFVYDDPVYADFQWDHLYVDWMNIDYHPDYPSLVSQYPTAPWNDAQTYQRIHDEIDDGKHEPQYRPTKIRHTTYIHDLTVDDLSVFNWTMNRWEDLHDESKWELTVRNDPDKHDYGFTLRYLEDGYYSYDMSFYLNKKPSNQVRNASLKRNAKVKLTSTIAGEVSHPAINKSVNTGRHLRIRKLFPYEQTESFTIGRSDNGDPLGYEMDFKVAPYMHYKNQILLQDVKIYNKTAGQYEDLLDPSKYEVRFKDPLATTRGFETQSRIVSSLISNPGYGFVDGEVWAWNSEFQIHLFGRVVTDLDHGGIITRFTPIHCVSYPDRPISLEFQVFQNMSHTEIQMGVVVVEFAVEKVEVFGDGYVHNVTNPFAPVPDEFKVVCMYDIEGSGEYDISINKTQRRWEFIRDKWEMKPVFHLDGPPVPANRLYMMTSAGRFPLVNPSTNKPTMMSKETESGTDVIFMNMYRRYEHIEIISTPYPMRSVYTQRRIPESGYIDLAGKINKPLNKQYFEFWVNGRLMNDEVTIITPTKIFMHGLKSLKNLEIIEINRDPNEYFSDLFIHADESKYRKPSYNWDYRTYLDDVLEGTLDGDNYTAEERESLLTPVWKQVPEDHPEFKNFPPNIDIETDILLRAIAQDYPIKDIEEPSFQFSVINIPTIEGHQISNDQLSFDQLGFTPISDTALVEMMNEEWKEEIESNPYFPEHAIVTEIEWYGVAVRLYDEYGIRVHNLNDAAYQIADPDILRINVQNRSSRIIKNKVHYDLS